MVVGPQVFAKYVGLNSFACLDLTGRGCPSHQVSVAIAASWCDPRIPGPKRCRLLEPQRKVEFRTLQDNIRRSSAPPKLKMREIPSNSYTFTPLILNSRGCETCLSRMPKLSHLKLATSNLCSLDIYKHRKRLSPTSNSPQNSSTKLPGRELDIKYSIQLML